MGKRYMIPTSSALGSIYKIAGVEGSNFIWEHACKTMVKHMVESVYEYFSEGRVYDTTDDIALLLESSKLDIRILPSLSTALTRMYYNIVSFLTDRNLVHHVIEFKDISMFNVIIEVS